MRSIVSGASLALLLTAPVWANPQTPEATPVTTNLDNYLSRLERSDSLSGTVLVARDGHIIFEHSYGKANVELGAPNHNDTRYRIFSTTKQFTAAAVLILAGDGRIDLHASVLKYLPELPAEWHAATVQEMLTHTSGIPNEENAWAQTFMQNDVKTQLANLALVAPKLAGHPLTDPPGTRWRYNNFAYDLLACIVARVSKQGYASFVRQHIFTPAGMLDAGFDDRRQAEGGMYVGSASVPRLASGYNGTPGDLMTAFPQMFASRGAGGIYATAEDLFHYDNAIAAGRIVQPELERQAIDSAFSTGPDASYGYGWMISRKDGITLIHHSGGTNGYVADYARYPASHICIVVLTNRGFTSVSPIRDAIFRMVSGTAKSH